MSYTGGVLLFPLVAGDRSQLGVIEFDCVVSEEHTVENEVTGYPVETGFIIADHAIKKNRKLSLNVIVGNTMSTGNYVNTVENSGLTPAGSVINSFPSIQEAHNHLTGVCIEARECQVSTIYGIYNHAIVTKYYTKQDVNNVSVIVARLEIEDIYKIDITGVGKTKGATTQYSNTKDTEAQSQVTSTGG
jgi:hypothetical protein